MPSPRYANHWNLLVYREGREAERPVRTVADWQVRRRHILESLQEVMGQLPDLKTFPPLDVQVNETIAGDGYQRLTITFAGDEDDRVPAFLYLPTNRPPGKKLPGIVAAHPTGAAGKGIVDDRGPLPNRGYGRELAQRGYIVIAPDYPSFGDYKYNFQGRRYVSGTMKGIVNHMRSIDLLVARDDVDPRRFGAIGHSLGGHNAMFLGVFDDRVQAIVSSCGWTPFREYYGHYQGKLSGWAQDRYMPRIMKVFDSEPERMPFDFYEIVGALAPRAFLSVSPMNDDNFDVGGVRKAIPQAQKVYDLLKASDRLQVRYPDCRHDFPDDMRRAAYEFFDRHLEHAPAREVP